MLSKEQLEREAHLYQLVMHVNGISSILSTLIAIFMILKKSTPAMGQYKWHLLNIVFWSALVDIYLGVLYVPSFMFPATGVCSYGLIDVSDNLIVKEFQFVSSF
jgi:heme/copper-type cytochrome/quinol oxidase subunit 1